MSKRKAQSSIDVHAGASSPSSAPPTHASSVMRIPLSAVLSSDDEDGHGDADADGHGGDGHGEGHGADAGRDYQAFNQEYFERLFEHEKMIADTQRMNFYHAIIGTAVKAAAKAAAKAGAKAATCSTGPVVLDVGTGTGVLAAWAEKAGASRVIAIDHSGATLELAATLVEANGCEKIEFMCGHSSQYGLTPEALEKAAATPGCEDDGGEGDDGDGTDEDVDEDVVPDLVMPSSAQPIDAAAAQPMDVADKAVDVGVDADDNDDDDDDGVGVGDVDPSLRVDLIIHEQIGDVLFDEYVEEKRRDEMRV